MMRRPTLTISWEAEMDIGIPEIDKDHKPIIILINEFNRSITEGKDPTEISHRLQRIIDDAVRHFSQEEDLFDKWHYPDTVSHARMHAHILNGLQGMKRGFIPYGVDSSWVEVGVRIKKILIDHFKYEDIKYAQYYRISSKVN